MRKTIAVLPILLCLLITLPFVGSKLFVLAEPDILNVDPSDPSAFSTIQGAINNASSGDTIFVHKGTYNESVEVNKSVSLVGEDRDLTIIDCQSADFAISITTGSVSIKSFTLEKSFAGPSQGIRTFSTSGTIISQNKIVGMYEGISFYASPNNVVSDNIMIYNNIDGISLYFSNNNVFSGNIILNNHEGISLYRSSNNVFSGNTISNNQNGASIDYTSNRNTFSHNNFDDAVKMESGSTNLWNSGGEGNYWRDYNGTDSNGDGIGDKPFSVDANNRDNAPLMGMFSNFNVVFTRETYQVSIISNSTVSGFGFEIGPETGNKIIRFNVAGEDGTVGFSRITIPTGLMNYSLIVFGEKEEIIPTELNKSSKTNVFLYFTYSHSNQTVAIISSNALNLYNELLEKYSKLTGDLYNLNVSYLDLLSSYAAFLDRYVQLQQDYLELNASYNLHLMDYSDVLQNFRSLTYIFAAATAVLIVSTVYISQRVHTRTIKFSEEKK